MGVVLCNQRFNCGCPTGNIAIAIGEGKDSRRRGQTAKVTDNVAKLSGRDVGNINTQRFYLFGTELDHQRLDEDMCRSVIGLMQERGSPVHLVTRPESKDGVGMGL